MRHHIRQSGRETPQRWLVFTRGPSSPVAYDQRSAPPWALVHSHRLHAHVAMCRRADDLTMALLAPIAKCSHALVRRRRHNCTTP